MSDDALVLGPLLRYVDETSATVWVETRTAGTVGVTAAGRSWSASTFGAHGHHYALVECDGLEPGTRTAYAVAVDGVEVWPPAEGLGAELPPSLLVTSDWSEAAAPLHLAFGSCRTSVPHDRDGNKTHGVDAMHAYAVALAGLAEAPEGLRRPDLLLFLGDQVYADETTEAMREFIASRRDIDEPPGAELKDYAEYAHLYSLAWSDPVDRWLLSTVPSAMIFDDHDVRDDWNTSAAWKVKMEATSWWHDRIVAGLASYWVYQHLGNLSPAERREDPVWRRVLDHEGPAEVDLSELLDAFADRADQEPTSYRWSYARDLGRTRLVVVDSRAARVLEEGRRSMLDDEELAWLDRQLVGGLEHVLIGTSLPFLLPTGLHHLEAFSEALAGGAWGRLGRRVGERLRQGADLEHWAAFTTGFAEVAASVLALAAGERGPAPRSVTFLSGDVHHSYVSQVVHGDDPAAGVAPGSAILQAVCSPMRNPLPRAFRFATAALSYGIAGPMGVAAARSAKVPDAPFTWKRVKGPWFDNNIAVVEVTGDGLLMRWWRGTVDGDRHDRAELSTVAAVVLEADGLAHSA